MFYSGQKEEDGSYKIDGIFDSPELDSITSEIAFWVARQSDDILSISIESSLAEQWTTEYGQDISERLGSSIAKRISDKGIKKNAISVVAYGTQQSNNIVDNTNFNIPMNFGNQIRIILLVRG